MRDTFDFFNLAPVGYFILDRAGAIEEVNQTGAALFGVEPAVLRGRAFTSLIAEVDRPHLQDHLQAAADSGQRQVLDLDLRSENGAVFSGRLESNAVRDASGAFLWCQSILIDGVDTRTYRPARQDSDGGILEAVVEPAPIGAAVLEEATARLKPTAKATAAVERRKRLYEAILSSTPDLVYALDLNHRFTYANEALLQMWGRTLEESIGKSLLEIGYEPWRAEMHKRELDQAIATKRPIRGEVPFPHAMLGTRIYDYIFVPVLNTTGEVEAIIGMARDITKRKRTEEALRESEARLEADLADAKLLQSISAQLIYEDDVGALYEKILDAAAGIMHSEYASMQIFYPERGDGGGLRLLAYRGFTPEAAKFWEWVHAGAASTCGEALRTGERVVVPDMEACPFMQGTEELARYLQAGVHAAQSTPLISRGGQILGMISTHWRERHEPSERDLRLLDILARQAADLIDRKRAEEALRENEERLREIFLRAPAIIAVLRGPDHVYESANPVYLQTVGNRDIVGKPIREALPELAGQGIFELLDQIYQTGEPFTANELRVLLDRRGSGTPEEVFFNFVYQPLFEADGSVSGIFVHAVDVTEQVRARRLIKELNETLEVRIEQRTAELRQTNSILEQKNRELQDFAYVASHDLQEPLRKIITFADLLRADLRNTIDDMGVFYVQRMQESAGRMSGLIRDLLSFSRVATHGQSFQSVDLNRVLSGVLSDLEVSITEAGAKVESERLPIIEADPVQMHQLFQNLIGNALKFRRMGVPPLIRLHSTLEAGDSSSDGRLHQLCRLSVEDNGIGFEEKYLDRIFAPFQRLHARLAYEGTGIGLAICRRIVERHRGTITAHSIPGQGSTFVVSLPVHHEKVEGAGVDD